MTATFPRLPSFIVRALAALTAAFGIASCGGGVSANPSPVVDSPTLTILPASAVLYSGLPTTFVFSGGTGAYIVASSNQAIVPVAGGVTGRSITVVPNPVAADTTVTLTLRDTGTAAPVSATLTVKPGTVNNDITITRTSTITGCTGVALCSGGDAEVTVTLSQGGIPLAARGVQFAVVSGDFRFITTQPGTSPETLDTIQSTATDQTGKARARIRILPAAANQTALLQITDLGSGAFQRTSFVIAQVTDAEPSFYTVPGAVDFVGPQANSCASSSAFIYVYGGTPPYSVRTTSAGFGVAPASVPASGGGFTLSTFGGTCSSEGFTGSVLVTDAAGRVRTVALTNKPTADALPDLAVAPDTVTLSSCGTTASVTVAGGTGFYYVGPQSGGDALTTSVFGNTVTIGRRAGSAAVTTTPPELLVGISDSRTTISVTVKLDGAGAGACP